MYCARIWFISIGLFALISCTKKDKPATDADPFDKQFSISAALDKQTSTLNVDVKLSPGMHAYAAGEKIGKPVRIEISPTNGWRASSVPDIPAGKDKVIAGLGTSIVLDGAFSIKQRVAGGNGAGEAILHLQVCSSSSCDRPRAHRLQF